MTKYSLLFLDALLFIIAAFLAWLVLVGTEYGIQHYLTLLPYLLVSFPVSAVFFQISRMHLHFFRLFSLYDLIHATIAITAAIIITLLISFFIFRLEGVPRSLPFLHWIFSLLGFLLLRLMGLLFGLHIEARSLQKNNKGRIAALVIGYNPVADLCLRSLPVFGDKQFFIAGVLDENPQRLGSRMRQCQVIGHPAELDHILAQMAVHGVAVRKILLTTALEDLGAASREAIDRLVVQGRIELHDYYQHLNDFFAMEPDERAENMHSVTNTITLPSGLGQRVERSVAGYAVLKRVLDVLSALILLVLMFPVMFLVAPLIRFTMGYPIIFWQERPGKNGKIFRLYKFRTMKHGVDAQGHILDDAQRHAPIGRFLRRTRLDETPQLFNVLLGDMSFVGPRPLLPVDLPSSLPGWVQLRMLVQPGLTGWAQINGGQEVGDEDKIIMDVRYILNMSFWQDILISLQTIKVVLKGEQLSWENICTSYRDMGLEPPEHARENAEMKRETEA